MNPWKGRQPPGISIYSRPAMDRVLDQISVGSDGCWEWPGYIPPRGYPTIWSSTHGRKVYLHRLSYETFRGPIPAGLVIDHLCFNPICMRPSHLEVVTAGENVSRGRNPKVVAHRMEMCLRGHSVTSDNRVSDGAGHFRCRTCRRAISRTSHERRQSDPIARERKNLALRERARERREAAAFVLGRLA